MSFSQEKAIIALGLHSFRGTLQVAQSWLNRLYIKWGTIQNQALRRISSHSWNYSQTIFSIEIWRQNHGCDYHLTDFFWKNMVASSFCHDRKFAFRLDFHPHIWLIADKKFAHENVQT